MSSSPPIPDLYNKNDLRITRTILEYKNTGYLIDDIQKFKIVKHFRFAKLIGNLILFSLIILVIASLFSWGNLVVPLLLFMIILIIELIRSQTIYQVIVIFESGEEISLWPIYDPDIKQLRKALEEALDRVEHKRWYSKDPDRRIH